MFAKYLPGFAAALTLFASLTPVKAEAPQSWKEIETAARGQTVYFHAWGGEPRINAYIDWAAEQLEERYGVTVKHVKVTDTAGTVTQAFRTIHRAGHPGVTQRALSAHPAVKQEAFHNLFSDHYRFFRPLISDPPPEGVQFQEDCRQRLVAYKRYRLMARH